MSRRFTGWPEQAFDVLLQLDGDPPAAVRERCRKDRERLVRAPMIALLQDIADADQAYDDFTVSGMGLPQYGRWQHQYATIRIARGVGIGLAFDLDGLRLRGTWWPADPGQLERFRTAIADESSGAELVEILHAFTNRHSTVTGDVMKRMPRGLSADHPRAELLRHRSVICKLPLGSDDWLHTPEAVDRVLTAAAELRPFAAWFAEHVATTKSG